MLGPAQTEHQERLSLLLAYLAQAAITSNVGDKVILAQHNPASRGTPVDRSRNGVDSSDGVTNPSANNGQEKPEPIFLYLDKDRKRKVVLQAPLAITQAEYQRLCKWIEVSLIIDSTEQATGKP